MRFVGVVRQSAADLTDSGIDSLFDVNEYVFAPEFSGDLLARNQLAALFNQEHEELQGQSFKANRVATSAELKTGVIEFEIVEANFLVWLVQLIRQSGTPNAKIKAAGSSQQDLHNMDGHKMDRYKFCYAGLAVSSRGR